MRKFKSPHRALRRGHLRIILKEIFLGWDASVVTGEITPRFGKIPVIERRTRRNNNKWIPYN